MIHFESIFVYGVISRSKFWFVSCFFVCGYLIYYSTNYRDNYFPLSLNCALEPLLDGRMNWESSIDIYTLPCVKQIASGKLLCNRELSSVLCDDHGVEWGGGEADSGGRRYMHTYGWFMLLYGRNQHNIVKQLSSN